MTPMPCIKPMKLKVTLPFGRLSGVLPCN
jgi:hypothetical protein